MYRAIFYLCELNGKSDLSTIFIRFIAAKNGFLRSNIMPCRNKICVYRLIGLVFISYRAQRKIGALCKKLGYRRFNGILLSDSIPCYQLPKRRLWRYIRRNISLTALNNIALKLLSVRGGTLTDLITQQVRNS